MLTIRCPPSLTTYKYIYVQPELLFGRVARELYIVNIVALIAVHCKKCIIMNEKVSSSTKFQSELFQFSLLVVENENFRICSLKDITANFRYHSIPNYNGQ